MTIEEMAKSYKDFREECGFKDNVALNEIEVAYEEGGNAVLEEIENELNKQPLKFGRTWRSMYNKLNELKGKE